jgi:hypothetical protein
LEILRAVHNCMDMYNQVLVRRYVYFANVCVFCMSYVVATKTPAQGCVVPMNGI